MPLGYILVGGASRRMRRDKALLPWYQGPLVGHLARVLRRFCGEVALVGTPRAGFEGFRVLPDFLPAMGPLGGIASALAEPGEPWRLVLSCDLALVDAEILEELSARAAFIETSNADLVAPETADGRLQPLCALWHQRVGPALAGHLRDIQTAPNGGQWRLSVWRFVQTLHTASFRPANPDKLRNINTMRDYLAALGGHTLLDGRDEAIPDSAKRTHGGAK